jgi:hypothetical protein
MAGAAEVATAAVALLSPFLPYLTGIASATAEKLSDTLLEKGGEAAWRTANSLWERLSVRWGGDPEVSSTATLVAVTPDRIDRRAELAEVLARKLESDAALLQELQAIVGGEQRVQEIIGGDRAVLERVSQRMRGAGRQRIELGADGRGADLNQVME